MDDEFNVLLMEVLDEFYQSVLNDEWDIHRAEDIAQEALLLAIEHSEQLRDPDELMAWMTTIRRRVSMRMSDDAKREEAHGEHFSYQKLSDMNETTKTHDPVTIAEDREERIKEAKLFKEGYQSLPLELRQVFSRYYRQGKAKEEIAAELGIKVQTVNRRLIEIRKRLSKYMRRMIVAYMTFELSGIDTKAMAAQIYENALEIHNAKLAAAATATTSAVTQSGASVATAKSAGTSLFSAILYLGMTFLSLLSLLFGGQLFGEYVVRNAPTLRARRWLVKRFLCWYGLLLTIPLAHAFLGIVMKTVLAKSTTFIHNYCYPIEGIVLLGTICVFLVGTVATYRAKCSQPESDRDGDFPDFQRFIRSGFFACAFLSFLDFIIYGGMIVFSKTNLYVLLHPGTNPVKFGYLVGTLVLFGILLTCIYGSFARCFNRLVPLAGDAESLPQTESDVSESEPGTWRTESFFVIPFAAFPLLANIAHCFQRQTHFDYSVIESVCFTIWWGLVLRANVTDTKFRWTRIVVSIVIQLCIMWFFRYRFES